MASMKVVERFGRRPLILYPLVIITFIMILLCVFIEIHICMFLLLVINPLKSNRFSCCFIDLNINVH
jgi:hypothetical protein